MPSVALIDDHASFRDVFAFLMQRYPDITVAAQAGSLMQARNVLSQARVDVVLLDLHLPAADGFEIARELKARDSKPAVLVLTMVDELGQVARALDAGVDGYALKTQSAEEIAQAIRMVADGKRYFAPSIDLKGVDELLERRRALSTLTDREREVFELVIRGRSTTVIGTLLGVSPRTIETHRGRILHKLNVPNAVELVRFAATAGLLGDA